MYKAIETFADLQDNKYLYQAGDAFPRAGLEVTDDRLKELSGNNNAMRRPLIAFVEEPKAKAGKPAAPKKNSSKKSKGE